MKIKHLLMLLILFASLLFPSKLLATSWAYPFVVWEGFIYVVSDEYVTGIEDEIGKVSKYSDMEQYAGNFSNTYKKGTKFYSIKGTNTDEAIAIQENNGKYKKAFREAEYTYAERKFDFPGIVVGFIALILIITALRIYFLKKKVNK